MANSDYQNIGAGSFATFVKTDVAYEQLDTAIEYTDFNFATFDAIKVGMAALWDDEICRVETVGVRAFTLKRGCADTLPARHLPGTIIWLLNLGTVGTDRKERSADETVAVKISPFTIGGGNLPIGVVAPDEVTFNWRYFRPYNAAYLFANAARWYLGATLNSTTGGVNLTWRDRNRVMQADQLLGQDDATMTPEVGTTYTMRLHDAGGALLREEPGIIGNAFLYQYGKALHDVGNPGTPVNATVTFYSERQGMESMQGYAVPVTIQPGGALPSVWQQFDQRGMASPYIMNVKRGLPPSTLTQDYLLAFGVRPADRMSDTYNMYRHWIETVDTGEDDGNGDPIYDYVHHHDLIGSKPYTPWVSLEFRLPELEQIVNVRSSSLYDGVRISQDLVGNYALIDDELVIIIAIPGDGTIKIFRGMGDTIPAVHIAGSRMFIFDETCVIDPTLRGGGSYDYRLQPGVYGPAVDVDTLPSLPINPNARGYRPYNVGQLQVNGRPWFEEAQAINGAPLQILWAWRNRITQSSTPVDHTYPSIDPEPGTTARVIFYYETPPASEGSNPVQHNLRVVNVNPVAGQDGSFQYTYAMALTDGEIAGQALGQCGTIVIYCRIDCVRENYISFQRYVIPVRVPSYPCT